MNKKLLVISFLIFYQCIIIFILLFSLNKSRKIVSIAPIEKKSIIFSLDSSGRHFYEPKANTVIENSPKYFTLPYVPSYTVNADNLNERYNYTIGKHNNVLRIITLGDSYTFGHYVDTKDNWPEQLEDILNKKCKKYKKYEVINLAERGYDISYSLERYKKRGIKYHPDLVLWFLKFDDFEEINDIVYPLSEQYRKDMEKNNMLQKFFNQHNFYPYRKEANKILTTIFTHEAILTAQKKYLESMNKYYTSTLVFIPFNLNKEQLQVLKDFSLSRSKTFILSSKISFDKLPDNHPSTTGHKTIAKIVYKYLLEKDIVPCN